MEKPVCLAELAENAMRAYRCCMSKKFLADAMRGILIATTSGGVLRPLAVQGISVPECHAQIVQTLRSRLGEAYAQLFAEPVFDRAQNITDWYTSAETPPVPLASLDAQQQNAVRDRIRAMCGEIQAVATDLAKHGVAGEILQKAMLYPGEQYIYVAGEQPIVTGWGHCAAGSGVGAEDLSRLHAFIPQNPTAPPQTEAADKAVPPSMQNSVQKKKGWLAWIFILLLLLLLATLLAALVSKMPFTSWFEKEIADLTDPVIERKKNCTASMPPDAKMPSAQNEPESKLDIPENIKAGDLTFLEGRWTCHSGITDKDGKSVVVQYIFNKHGQGSIAIRGENTGLCQAKAEGRVSSDGILNLTTEPAILCPDGKNFYGQNIECRKDGQDTICHGRNTGSNTMWNATFTRD